MADYQKKNLEDAKKSHLRGLVQIRALHELRQIMDTTVPRSNRYVPYRWCVLDI